MPEICNAVTVEGYFSWSRENDGNLALASSEGHHHVQIRTTDGNRLLYAKLEEGDIEDDVRWESRGIACYLSQNEVIGARRFVVECSDINYFEPMNRVIATILQHNIIGAKNIINLFRSERLFWAHLPFAMTQEKATGLFGELFFMYRWLPNQLAHLIENEIWTGPLGTDKDFNHSTLQIEVKTAMSPSTPIQHTISTLHQLQEDGCPLVLFSLVAHPDDGGSESLWELVESIIALLEVQSSPSVENFKHLLNENDYIYGDPRLEQYRFTMPNGDGTLYAVKDHFPRLVSDDNVEDARIHLESYRISLSGIEDLILNIHPEIGLEEIVESYNLLNE